MKAAALSSTYAQQVRLLPAVNTCIVVGGLVIAMVLLPLFAPARIVSIASLMLITAIVVVGLQVTIGQAGQINMGAGAFMGVGAYAAAVLAQRLDFPFWLNIPLGGASAAAFGLVFGMAAARIKGFYLAMTTLTAQVLFQFAVLNLPGRLLGGSGGLSLEAAQVSNVRIATDAGNYWLALAVALPMIAGACGINRSRFGRACIAVRDDDLAAGPMGIPVTRTKVTAFMVGAFYAGVGGAVWAYSLRYVAVDQFTLLQSVWFIGMLIVGGMGSIGGALAGVIAIRAVQEALTGFGPDLVHAFPALGSQVVFATVNIVLGASIAFFLIVEPRGLVHYVHELRRFCRTWPLRH
jgi:branched-chain amino acid transport system permease protein